MKKLVTIFLFLLFAFSYISAKKFVKKWIIIRDTENKIVYIDTSSIRKSDGQLSLWSLVKYKHPKEFVMYQGKVSQIKSHILFNIEKNRYTVIGALFFDKRARIIGESTTPTVYENQKIISSPIIEGSDQQILLNKANEYVATGKIIKKIPQNIMDKKTDKFVVHKYSEPAKVVKDSVINPFGNVPSEPVLSDDSTIIGNSIGNELRQELIEPETEDSSKITADTVSESTQGSVPDSIGNFIGEELKKQLQSEEDSSTINYDSQKITKQSPNLIIDVDTIENNIKYDSLNSNNIEYDNYNIKNSADLGGTDIFYNTNNEEQVTKNIWSDGNLFVIQLSSWRSKKKAESIVNKLEISNVDGKSVFVFGKYIPKKRRKYYRVRIGYFTSLSNAEDYFKTIK